MIPEYEDYLMTLVYMIPDDQKDKALVLKNMISNYIKSLKKTLRDECAMAALTGFNSNQGCNKWSARETALVAYRHADAMLDERNKEPNRD